jgi:ABC-type multidrug transport system fused ATPase/permease subunit
MRDGQIIERGSHSELLARGQEYSKLYAMQFEEREAAAEVGIQ